MHDTHYKFSLEVFFGEKKRVWCVKYVAEGNVDTL